jgi:hypothetical protein
MPRKKPDGISALVSKDTEPVSIQALTMQDWYAGFALMGLLARGEEVTDATVMSAIETGVYAVEKRQEILDAQQ